MSGGSSMDQYEKQLFSLFSSYDSSHSGKLSRQALQELCVALQLEERGQHLVDLLCPSEEDQCLVTFQQFRDGLLAVLGDESYDGTARKGEPNENHSEGDSSGREVSPKYVFGSKKYGRRSRPSFNGESVDIMTHASDDIENLSKDNNRKTPKVRRSVSLNEGRRSDYTDSDTTDPSRYTTHLSVTRVENIECSSNSSYMSPDCNSNTEKTLHSSSIESIENQELDGTSDSGSVEDLIPTRDLVELWESVGIPHPQRFLKDLGFQNRKLKISQVLRVLEEEARMLMSNMQESSTLQPSVAMFQAILSLYHCDNRLTKCRLNQTVAERNKLKTDLADANQRAILLAHEVDENHVNMENIMKQNIKQLESKHADAEKQMMEEFTSEKELSSLTISRLEDRLLTLETEETKLKSQVSNLQEDNLKLEKELNKSQEQLFELTDIKNHLTKELKLLGNERQKSQSNLTYEKDVEHLENQLVKYQTENIKLKDKNDELCTELDNLKATLSSNQFKTVEQNIELSNFEPQVTPLNSLSSSTDNSLSTTQIDMKAEDKHYSSTADEPILMDNAISDLKSPPETRNECHESIYGVNDKENVLEYKSKLNLIVDFNDVTTEHIMKLLEFFKIVKMDQSDDIFNEDIKPYIICLYAIIKKISLNLNNLLKDDQVSDNDKTLESDLSVTIHNIVNEILDYKFDSVEIDRSLNVSCKHIGIDQTDSSNGNNANEEATLSEQLTSLKDKVDQLNDCLEKERSERNEGKVKELEKYQELESNMELLRNEYFKCEEYWSTKLNEEREIFDQEQRITDEKFAELLTKLSEYEEQFTAQDNKADRFDGPLSTIEEKCHLEKQFNDLEDEFEEYKTKAEKEIKAKDLEISELKEKISKLEECMKNVENIDRNQQSLLQLTSFENECVKEEEENDDISNLLNANIKASLNGKDLSFVNSPINYLWSQKTIPSPITNMKTNSDSQRDYHNPAYMRENSTEITSSPPCITPIQKPISSKVNIVEPVHENVAIRNGPEVKHEAKMLHCADLEEALQGRKKQVLPGDENRNKPQTDIQTFNVQKPSLQAQNNSAILRTVALEIHCRQLQAALRQQQAYAEGVFQQTVAAHRAEMGALKQRLAAADLLVRDLYVENCHLAHNMNNPILK